MPAKFSPDPSKGWKGRISGYWRKRAADHRPPPLQKPTNDKGEELVWGGPAHRKPATPLAPGEEPPRHKPHKKRNLKQRFFSPQQVRALLSRPNCC